MGCYGEFGGAEAGERVFVPGGADDDVDDLVDEVHM